MEAAALVSITFDAAHQLPDIPACAKMHGHRYRVQVTTANAQMAGREGPDPAALREDLAHVAHELDNRFLNEMLPGVAPTPYGIAAWFAEQLALRWPVHTVTVWQDPDSAVQVTREVRRAF